jgi:DNA primase catalytic subunit
MEQQMNRQQILEYYSREEIINELIKNAKGREVAGAFIDGSYDQRPNILQFPADVTQMVKKGVTSFHFSVEHWRNPMQIIREKYQELRIGFDFIMDIDSKLGLDEARIAAEMICSLLKSYGVRNYGIKFSGRRGFHLCVPWNSFPKEIDYKPLAEMYPRIPRILAGFIRERISDSLMKELIKRKGAKQLIEILEEPPDKLDPFYFVEIEKDWGSRHMFRAPYSLNEKTWLVSLPIKESQLKDFSPETAKPEKVRTGENFFRSRENEAENLLIEALDWNAMQEKEVPKKEKKAINWEQRVPEEFFPPCIKLILAGLPDGRKRSVFTLTNFLRMMNWPWHEIENKVMEWNSKNKQELPRNIILGQLRWNQANQMNPANCDSDMFYKGIGICKPDETCRSGTDKITITNPINYPFRRMKTKKIFRGFSCNICNEEFKTMRSLRAHKTRVHEYKAE